MFHFYSKHVASPSIRTTSSLKGIFRVTRLSAIMFSFVHLVVKKQNIPIKFPQLPGFHSIQTQLRYLFFHI